MTQDPPSFVPVDFDPFADGELALTSPAIEAQREIWASVQLGPDASCAFNEAIALTLRGSLDPDALATAIRQLGERHESLRATLSPEGDQLCIGPTPTVTLERLDASTAADPAAALTAYRVEEVETPFDLEHGPLWRARLVKLAGDHHVLLLTGHHIICDGWSMAVMLDELGPLYSAARRGAAADLPAAEKFSDYAARTENSDEAKEAEAWWLGQYADLPPPLEMPTDKPRPPMRSFNARREDHELPRPLVTDLKKTAAAHKASFLAMLIAGWAGYIARITGQTDLVIGVPASGQAETGMHQLVGHCVNFLPVRLKVDLDAPFSQLLERARSTMLDVYDHQRLTFGRLLRGLKVPRDPQRIPLLSVSLNVDQAVEPSKLRFDGLTCAVGSTPRHYENFELFVNVAETAAHVIAECQYNTDLFDQDGVRDRLAQWETLLGHAARAPQTPVGDLDVMTAAQREQVLRGWNATATAPREDSCVHRLIERVVDATPDAVATQDDARTMTYREVEHLANRLARRLVGLGVKLGDRVGVAIERTAALPAILLGVLKSGAAYVPLDHTFPRDRLAYMVEDAALAALVTERDLADAVPLEGGKVLLLDDPAIGAESDARLDVVAAATDIAYVLYTSGSTGRPKGVEVTHGGVVNLLSSMRRHTPGIAPTDVVLAMTTISFDIHVFETLLPLAAGARSAVVVRDTAGDAELLARAIEKHGATVVQATPATWRLLIGDGWQGRPGLRAVSGGEALPRGLADDLLARVGELWDIYAPTETTVYSIGEQVRPTGPITIGKPLDNTQIYILDSRGQPVPPGVLGEIIIAGHGVARGYRNLADQTAQRFLADRFAGTPEARMYRTGDHGRWLRDGRVFYERRMDDQVKVRGFRIELGDVEAAVARVRGVAQSAVTVIEPKPGDVRLVAYVVPEAGAAITVTELRRELRKRLPDYMVPQHMVELAALPRTPSGKLDRKALPSPLGDGKGEEKAALTTDTQRWLAGVWSDALGVPRVGPADNFFDLGGHSLLSMQVISRINAERGVRLSPRAVLRSSLEQLAAQLDGGGDAATT